MSEMNMGNLYDANKSILKAQPYPKWKDISKKLKEIEEWILNSSDSIYYMLLNNELRDYTLFRINKGENDPEKAKMMAQDINECMQNRSLEFLAIDKEKDQNVYSLWLRSRKNEEVYCYMLFPYDDGVIEYN